MAFFGRDVGRFFQDVWRGMTGQPSVRKELKMKKAMRERQQAALRAEEEKRRKLEKERHERIDKENKAQSDKKNKEFAAATTRLRISIAKRKRKKDEEDSDDDLRRSYVEKGYVRRK